MPKLLYPVQEGAEQLGIGRSKMWELIAAGEIATVKIGVRRLVPAAELERYAHSLQPVEAAADAG